MDYDDDLEETCPERVLMGGLCLVSAIVVGLILYWVL